MAHNGSLRDHRFAKDVPDVGGATVYGLEGEKIGNIDEVIFDHETMEISYVVIEGGNKSQSHNFLSPANQLADSTTDSNSFAIGVTKQQSEEFPDFDESSLKSEETWKKYLDEFQKFWEEYPVMHRKDSYRIVTPNPEELRASGKISAGDGDAREASGDEAISAADLFPERITDVFSDPTPGGHKVTLRPRSVVRAEEAASGVALLKPRWDSCTEHLRRDHASIESECPQCARDAEKARTAA